MKKKSELATVHKTPQMLEIEKARDGKDIRLIIKELYDETGSITLVAKELGVDTSVISLWGSRLGILFTKKPMAEIIGFEASPLQPPAQQVAGRKGRQSPPAPPCRTPAAS